MSLRFVHLDDCLIFGKQWNLLALLESVLYSKMFVCVPFNICIIFLIFQKHIVSWSELLDIGRELPDGKLDDRLRRIAINHCCNVLYSSGTNRPQRGVMLSHDNLTWCSKMVSMEWYLIWLFFLQPHDTF